MQASENPSQPNYEDFELVQKVLAGDQTAFESIVRTHGGKMLNVAKRITRNDADAQDCLQEAFIKTYTSLNQFNGHSSLGTWLHKVVVNTSLMRLRSQKRIQEDSIDSLLPAFDGHGHRIKDASVSIDDQDSGVQAIEKMIESGETMATIQAAIDRLPDEYRAIIIARDVEELTTEETATLLSISRSLVKTRLHRARAALKTLLDPVIAAGVI